MEAIRGKVDFPDGPHIAIAYSLKDQQGYILMHCLAKNAAVPARVIARSLLAVGGIAFLLISALLGMTVYMLSVRLYDTLCRKHTKIEQQAIKRAQTLLRTRDAVIFGLANLTDSRDSETGGHLERMAAYCSVFTTAMRRGPKYRNVVTHEFARLIEVNVALHDIGKVGIQDAILLKRGPLTDAERIRMQDHTTIGGKCLKDIEQRLGRSNFLQMAREITLYHHEHWDGNGYPSGLAGEEIPLAARIVSIVDVYEALSSKRAYKEAFPHDRCVAIIREQAGRQFDPGLVEVFLQIESRFGNIARQYGAVARPAPAQSLNEAVLAANQEDKDLALQGTLSDDD